MALLAILEGSKLHRLLLVAVDPVSRFLLCAQHELIVILKEAVSTTSNSCSRLLGVFAVHKLVQRLSYVLFAIA